MRWEFGKWIAEKAEEDESIVLIVNDIGYGIFDDYRKKFKDRFFNFGIAEQSTVSAAAGMALEGLKPYVYGITPFLIERAFEQVKIDMDMMATNVTLVGYCDYPSQGNTHEFILRPESLDFIFNSVLIYEPRSAKETREELEKNHNGFFAPAIFFLKRCAKST